MTIGKALLLTLSLVFFTNGFAAKTSTDDTAANTATTKQQATNSKKQKHTQQATTKLMRLGSGAIGGNYFVLGELVGGIISHPPGSLPCGKGGTCGLPNLQSQNITTSGSLANLSKLQNNTIQSGFIQSDIAYWAYTGTGLFANKDKQPDLRAIASLYPEAMHIVVRKSANIQTVADLADKRVSVGARKSGTLNGTRLVLEAYKLSEDDMQTEYLNNQQSIKKLQDGELDAMFFLVGAPAPGLDELFAKSKDFTLLSIGETERQSIFKKGHYYSPYTLSASTYPHIPATQTISVYALWLTKDSMDEETVYQITKALWSDTAKQLLNSSYIGKQITVNNSLNGIGIPLHKGAKKYYNEIGKRF